MLMGMCRFRRFMLMLICYVYIRYAVRSWHNVTTSCSYKSVIKWFVIFCGTLYMQKCRENTFFQCHTVSKWGWHFRRLRSIKGFVWREKCIFYDQHTCKNWKSSRIAFSRFNELNLMFHGHAINRIQDIQLFKFLVRRQFLNYNLIQVCVNN